MAKQAKYLINGKPFFSKKAMQSHFQMILAQSVIGADLPEDEFLDCLDLFKRHPEYEQKVGCGIRSVRVILDPIYFNRCFWIYRFDGSNTDISYRTCIDAKPRGAKEKFLSACRYSISNQIVAFKAKQFKDGSPVFCKITGKQVQRHECDVDHLHPFSFLIADFVKIKNIDIDAIEYVDRGDGHMVYEFLDKQLEADWKSFHYRHAVLQITKSEANQAKGCKVEK